MKQYVADCRTLQKQRGVTPIETTTRRFIEMGDALDAFEKETDRLRNWCEYLSHRFAVHDAGSALAAIAKGEWPTNDETPESRLYRRAIASEARVAELEDALRAIASQCCLESDHSAVEIARAALAEVADENR